MAFEEFKGELDAPAGGGGFAPFSGELDAPAKVTAKPAREVDYGNAQGFGASEIMDMPVKAGGMGSVLESRAAERPESPMTLDQLRALEKQPVPRAGEQTAAPIKGKTIPLNENGTLSRAASLVGSQVDAYSAGLGYKVGDMASALGADKAAGELRGRASAVQTRADSTNKSISLSADGAFEKYAPQILAVFPTMAVAAATGGLPVMFGIAEVQSYAEGRKAGLSPAMALGRAVPMGAAEVIGEKLGGTGKLLEALEKAAIKGGSLESLKELSGRMAAAGMREVPSEEATFAMQFGIDKAPGIGLRPDAGVDDFIEGAKDTAIVAAGAGGMMAGGSMALNRLAAREKSFAEKYPAAPSTPPGVPPAPVDPVAAIAKAQTVDEAIAAATRAVQSSAAVDNIAQILEQNLPPAQSTQAPAAIENIAGLTPDVAQTTQAITDLEAANVSPPAAVQPVAAGTPGSGMPEPGVSLEAPLGTERAAGPAVDAGRVPDQSDRGFIPLEPGTPLDAVGTNVQNQTPAGPAAQAQAAPAQTPEDRARAGVQPAAAGTPAGKPQLQTAGVAARPSASWVIREKETGSVIMETFDKKKVDALNTEKYEAVPIKDYLVSLTPGSPSAPSVADKPASASQTPFFETQTPQRTARQVAIDAERKSIEAKRASRAAAKAEAVTGEQLNKQWTAFAPDSGTLSVPRADMPQIKAEHRGAMVNFLNARDIAHTQEEVPAASLKPTQAEFSPAKVEKALGFTGPDRSILVSSDNHVLDGHHQWMSKLQAGEPVKIIRLGAPIKQLLETVKEFPSAEQARGATAAASPAPAAPAPQGKQVSFYPGKYGKGMGKEAAKLEAMRLNRLNAGKGVTYAAEEHNDPKLENPYAVVGRKDDAATKAELSNLSRAQQAAGEEFADATPELHRTEAARISKVAAGLTKLPDIKRRYEALAESHRLAADRKEQRGASLFTTLNSKIGFANTKFDKGPATAQQAMADAVEVLGFDPKLTVLAENRPDMLGTPMRYDLQQGVILYNTAVERGRAADLEYMIEEVLHALDHVGGQNTISASNPRFMPGGDIRQELESAYAKSAAMADVLAHPLDEDYTDSVVAAELFARTGAKFYSNPNLLRVTAPKTYELFKSAFGLPRVGSSVPGQVRRSSTERSSQVGQSDDGNAGSLPRNARSNPAQSGDGLQSLRESVLQEFGGQPAGQRVDFGSTDRSLKTATPAERATDILDAAAITGKDRLEALRDVRAGLITPDELATAYPARGTNEPVTNPKDVVGNQGGRSADDTTPGAQASELLLEEAKALREEARALELYLRDFYGKDEQGYRVHLWPESSKREYDKKYRKAAELTTIAQKIEREKYDSNPERVKRKEQFLEEVESAVAAGQYVSYGIRVNSKNPRTGKDVKVKVGGIARPSYYQPDGEVTNTQHGTSAIAVDGKSMGSSFDLIRNYAGLGEKILLLGSDSANSGNDPGEIEMRDAKILAIYDDKIENEPTAPDSGGAGRIQFSRSTRLEEANALEAISRNDDLFALPKSEKITVEGITADNAPGITVKKMNYPGLVTTYALTMPDGAKANIMVRKVNPYGEPQAYGMVNREDGEFEASTDRPGRNPENVPDGTEDVYIDVSNLKEGGQGRLVYNIAATFAHNTDRILIGDPAGLSNAAMRRRTEHMLSSALKFGTTRHLAPHPRQTLGAADIGVPPLRWTYGDDLGNIKSLIEVSTKSLENAGGNPFTFDPTTGSFRDSEGDVIDKRGISLVAELGSSLPGKAGGATLQRSAVLSALLREQSQEGSRAGQGMGILERLVEWGREHSLATRGIFYSEGSTPAVRNPSTVDRVQAAVTELIGGKQLPNKLGRVVATTASEIKSRWEPILGQNLQIGSEGEAGVAQGFFDPATKTVFLIADHIEQGNELAVLAHELMHKHGQTVLGKDGWDKLHNVINGWANAPEDSDERAVYNYARAKVEAVGMELSSQEMFPYAVEAAIKMGVKPSLIAKNGTVARWLGSVKYAMQQAWGKVTGKPETFKTQDLVDLAFGISQREHSLREEVVSLQDFNDGFNTRAELLSNAARRMTSMEQGLDGLDADTVSMVKKTMLRLSHDHEILKSVIELIPVDVVNALARQKITPEMLFHDPSMLQNSSASRGGNKAVSLPVDAVVAVIDAAAQVAAKRPAIFGAKDRGRPSKERGITDRTRTDSAQFFDDGRVPVKNSSAATATKNVGRSENLGRLFGDRDTAMGTLDDRHVVTPISDGVLGAGAASTVPAPPSVSINSGRVNEDDLPMFSRTATQTGTPATQPNLSPWRDETGRLQFAPGAWLYDQIGKAASPMLVRLGMKAATPELRRQLRQMKIDVEKAQEVAVAIAKETTKLSEEERAMVSDLVEQELKVGVIPPAHAVKLAAMINDAMGRQTDELVSLGMLTKDSADKWRGKYLPRYYESKLKDKLATTGATWADALMGLTGRQSVMKGIKGKNLKGRGLYETIPEADLPNYEALGWEVRDPDYTPSLPTVDGTVQVWRDFSPAEREKMGEIRDAGFRFVMGYMQTQRDIALGRMFERMAQDPDSSSRLEKEGYVQVPTTVVSGTGAKVYGKLAGRWVPVETMSQLSNIEESTSAAWQMYRKALGIWKLGKTAMNPVSHANNIVSNLTMAHLAGVSYLRGDKYLAAARDMVKKSAMVQEAKDNGLFLGTLSDTELMNSMPEELRILAQKQESTTLKVARTGFDILTMFLRKPMGAAYQAEDTFFRYLIYKDARERGTEPQDAVDYAQRYIFTYDDLPKGARMVRDFGIPFFSYTYKAVPALLHTALTHPLRMAAPAAVLWGINAAAYAIATGDDDDDWQDSLQKYLTDPAHRAKAREQEKLEREFLPPWNKGTTSMLTPKMIRLGMDEVTKLPLFIDVSRIIPGGDMFDVSPNAGGIPLPQPITPSHPLFTTAVAMLGNKDLFRGKDLVDKNDTRGEATEKRLEWLWTQLSPAVAAGNYHWERGMNALAQANGGEVKWMPDVLGGDATGIGKDGLPVQPKYAAMQTFGIKVRPLDLDTAQAIEKSMQNKMVRDMDTELKALQRLNNKGAVSDRVYDKAKDLAREKKDRLKDGKTVDGDDRD